MGNELRVGHSTVFDIWIAIDKMNEEFQKEKLSVKINIEIVRIREFRHRFHYDGLKIKEMYAFQLTDGLFNRKPMN